MPTELTSLILFMLTILQFAIIGRALLSWFDRSGQNPLSRILIQITEPFIAPIRSFMPRTGMIDFSPLIALFIIIFLQMMIRSAST